MNTHKNCTMLKEEYFFYIRTSKFGAEAERSHFFCDSTLKTFLACS